MIKRILLMLAFTFCAMGGFNGIVSVCHAQADPIQPRATMSVDQLRPGMKGYGMTVFEGTTIEPFPVEVVSVMGDFAAKQSVIWIRCTSERMQHSGPVAGMSGSPIYIWDENEPQELGKGGRLIGAFAFGYRGAKDCYVGVQPIGQMRAVAARARQVDADKAAQKRNTPGTATMTLLRELARSSKVPTRASYPLALWSLAAPVNENEAASTYSIPTPDGFTGAAYRMMLPVTVPTRQMAQVLAPLFAPLGLEPVAGGEIVAGNPPSWIDPQAVKIEPGSVLSVPFVFGDLDLSGVGTTTDVLPDGRVLAFGHAMFGEGESTMPMASGFVHFIFSGYSGSFKVGGSAALRGGLVRDENSAIVGSPQGKFTTIPAQVSVTLMDQPPREYHYQLVHNRQFTPILGAIVAARSLTAIQNLPAENTVMLESRMVFEGDRVLNQSAMLPLAGDFDLIMSLAGPVGAMYDNAHGITPLKSLSVKLKVIDDVKLATIIGAEIQHATIAPGKTLNINVRLQKFGGETMSQKVSLFIPPSVPDGDYNLMICGASRYAQLLSRARPHLGNTTSVDDVFELLELANSIKSDALYVMLQLNEPGLAVGRREMPYLPSSRQAMLATPTSTNTSPYVQWIEKVQPMDLVPEGQAQFQLSVRRTPDAP